MTLNKKDLITIRQYIQDVDQALILSSWLKGLYYGESWFSDIKKDSFMKVYHHILETALISKNITVDIACLKDDPEVILGYSVYSKSPKGSALHWVFVKDAWRKIGVAKDLIPSDTYAITHLTALGRSLWKEKFTDVYFDPFEFNLDVHSK